MQNIHVPLPAIVTFLLDIVVVVGIAMVMSYPGFYPGSFYGGPISGPNLAALGTSAIFAAFTMGLYQREFWGRSKLPQRLALALFLSVIVASGFSIIGKQADNVWIAVLLINIPAFVLMLLNRLICGFIAERLKTSTVYFGPEAGLSTLKKIERSLKPSTFAVTGAFSSPADVDRAQLSGLFGSVRPFGANEIVVSGSKEAMDKFAKAFMSFGDVNARVTLLSAFVERESRKIDIYDPEAARQLTFYRERRTRLSMILKRVLDIVFALVFLLLTLPVTVLLCLLLMIFDGRPVFYHQERTGLGGRVFTLHKFRTMTVDAEADGIALWTSLSDSRVTRMGHFLRISRIDEIPQLINVLRGDMTLVGPRPERPSIVAALQEKIPLYATRHTVVPGITGWAQINYPYGASVEDSIAKTCYDLYYVKNASLLLDIAVILQTVRVILLGEGSR
jgi:exopolysaccharide biosynthesis polyprenyl glycosylphosphotransferase